MVKNKAINDDFLKASPNNKDFYALRESAIETKSLSFRMEGKIGEKDVEYLSFDGNDLNITLSDTDTELWPTDSKVNIEFANPESGYLVLSVRAAGELIYIFKGYVHGETGDASYNGVVYSKDGKQPFAFKDSMGYWGN